MMINRAGTPACSVEVEQRLERQHIDVASSSIQPAGYLLHLGTTYKDP